MVNLYSRLLSLPALLIQCTTDPHTILILISKPLSKFEFIMHIFPNITTLMMVDNNMNDSYNVCALFFILIWISEDYLQQLLLILQTPTLLCGVY